MKTIIFIMLLTISSVAYSQYHVMSYFGDSATQAYNDAVIHMSQDRLAVDAFDLKKFNKGVDSSMKKMDDYNKTHPIKTYKPCKTINYFYYPDFTPKYPYDIKKPVDVNINIYLHKTYW